MADADKQPTYEDMTRNFVMETAEPQLKENPSAEEKPKDAVAEAPTAEVADEAESTEAADESTEGGESASADDKSGAVGEDQTGTPKRKLTAAQRHAEIQRKTDELIRNQREAERRLADVQARLEQADKPRGLTEQSRDTTKEEGDAPPDANDAEKYPYGVLDERYLDDRAEYLVEKKLKAREAQAETQRQADAASAKLTEMQQKADVLLKAGAAKHEDFEEVVVEGARSGAYPLSPVLGELILSSPEGADVAYHLASNPKEAREIAGKSPLEQAAYFGRIAAKFSSTSSDAPGKPPAKTTQAPPPPKTTVRGAGATTTFDPATSDFEAFERGVRQKQ